MKKKKKRRKRKRRGERGKSGRRLDFERLTIIFFPRKGKKKGDRGRGGRRGLTNLGHRKRRIFLVAREEKEGRKVNKGT